MAYTRRKTIALVGGGLVLAATASVATFVATRAPRRALAPWDAAGRYDDLRLRALSYALLAPNPHNRQPWLARLVDDDGVEISRDPARDLPVTDPEARQLTIGMGCFLELMSMAAAQEGFAVERTLFPSGEDGPVAACRFIPGAATPDPLFATVLRRRSHKESFDGRAVSAEAAMPLEAYAEVHREGPRRDALRQLAHDAWRTETATPAAYRESIDLLRIGRAEIEANPDGIDVGGPMPEAMALVGLFTRDAAADPNNPGSKAVIDDTAAAILSAPAMTLLATPGNARVDQIGAGARWLRLNLAAAGGGLALRPVSQALQEYPEVRRYRDAVQASFGGGGRVVQMLGLLGYGRLTPRTPRWPLETRLLV